RAQGRHVRQRHPPAPAAHHRREPTGGRPGRPRQGPGGGLRMRTAEARSEPDSARDVPAVHLDEVRKRYDDVAAVDGVSLEVVEGEFFSLLGPSGSGKTTCLRMIAGFELPTEGRILLDGLDVTGVPPYERDVNTVFQD